MTDHTTAFGLAVQLSQGGRKRLAALERLATLIATDCGRQVGEMQGRGWDAKEAAHTYRDWAHHWLDDAIDRFVAEQMRA